MSEETLSYEQKLLSEESQHYILCMKDSCSRHEHCLHWLVGQWVADDQRIITAINPLRKDVREGNCKDFRSDKKRTMARGMVGFYKNIPEPMAKAIRKDLIRHFTKTKYFKFRNGSFPITSEDQQQIADICRANGWTYNPIFDNYYEEFDF